VALTGFRRWRSEGIRSVTLIIELPTTSPSTSFLNSRTNCALVNSDVTYAKPTPWDHVSLALTSRRRGDTTFL